MCRFKNNNEMNKVKNAEFYAHQFYHKKKIQRISIEWKKKK